MQSEEKCRFSQSFWAKAAVFTALTAAFALFGCGEKVLPASVPTQLAQPSPTDTVACLNLTPGFCTAQTEALALTDELTAEAKSLQLEPTPTKVVKASSSSGSSSSSKPSISSLMGMSLDDIYKINKDIYGKLKLPGAGISELVVLTKNELDYYRYNFYKVYDRYGTIFADNQTHRDSLDRNTVLYGHNRGMYSQNYKKFGTLTYYRSKSFTKDNPYIYLETFHGKYKFQIFSVQLREDFIPKERYIENYMRTDFSTNEQMGEFLDVMKSKSMFDTGVSVSGSDYIITLVTCVYDFTGAKLVVMGKLVGTY